MGRWTHRLSNINPQQQIAICAVCGIVKVKIRRPNTPTPRYACIEVERERLRKFNATPSRLKKFHERIKQMHKPYLIHRKQECERCGYRPPYVAILDVHHKDGNHKNNHPENLETLCPNCHRLHHYETNPLIRRASTK